MVGGAEHKSSATVSSIMRALGLADVQFEAPAIRASELESTQDSRSGINDLSVTSGVTRFKLANWSPLRLGPLRAGGDVVLADPGRGGKVAMVDQALGRGAVAVLGCPDVFRMDLIPADSPLLYNLAHRAKESVDQCGTQTTLTASLTSATTMSRTSATSHTSVTSRTSQTTLTLTTLTWTTALPTTTTAARRRRATPWPGYSR